MTPSATSAQGGASPKGRNTWLFAIAAMLIAGAAITFLAVGGLGKNLVYYWGPTELFDARAKAVGATIRLGGKVAPGSIAFEEGTSDLRFAVTDGAREVLVHTHGVPPAMFRENIGVVVEGTATASGSFEGNRLMVSHSNEYRAPKAGEKVDVRALIQSAEASSAK
jgi:cytochrome c-type biogenesis protein CcmE